MRSFRLAFATDNAAFDDDARPEIVRILREIAAEIESNEPDELFPNRTIRDVNGNDIGRFYHKEGKTPYGEW